MGFAFRIPLSSFRLHTGAFSRPDPPEVLNEEDEEDNDWLFETYRSRTKLVEITRANEAWSIHKINLRPSRRHGKTMIARRPIRRTRQLRTQSHRPVLSSPGTHKRSGKA